MIPDTSLGYAELHAVDEVVLGGDQLALAAAGVGPFANAIPRQATSVFVFGTQPFNVSLTGANPPAVATAGVILVPAGVAVRLGLELDKDLTIAVANVGAAAGNFSYIAFRRRRRQPRLPGQV